MPIKQLNEVTEPPTKSPTFSPTNVPTKSPTDHPTMLPTRSPTDSPRKSSSKHYKKKTNNRTNVPLVGVKLLNMVRQDHGQEKNAVQALFAIPATVINA